MAELDEIARLVRRSDEGRFRWFLAGNEVWNGTILEVAIYSTKRWLPIWIEGLPENPTGVCMVAGTNHMLRLPLYPPGVMLRWAKGVDTTTWRVARRAAHRPPVSDMGEFFEWMENPKERIAEVLAVLGNEHRYLREFATHAFACVYPREVALLRHAERTSEE